MSRLTGSVALCRISRVAWGVDDGGLEVGLAEVPLVEPEGKAGSKRWWHRSVGACRRWPFLRTRL